MRKTPTGVDEYILSFPVATQKKLRQVRSAIKKVAPKAEEKISYGIPAFRISGEYLIYFAAFANHLSLYPAPRNSPEFRDELRAFKGGKGTMQMPLDESIPASLIQRIVRFRLGEVNRRMRSKLKGGRAFLEYHKDGSTKAKGSMIGKEMHGYWEWYRKDSSLMKSGYYSRGVRTGEWITYDSGGKMLRRVQMS